MSDHPFSEKVKGCKQCPYYKRPFVAPQIRKDAEVMFVVGAPNEEAVERDKPIAGMEADQFDEFLLTSDLGQRKDAYITSGVKCQPPIDKARRREEDVPTEVIHKCRDLFLIPEIKKFKPNVVVPMGNNGMQAVMKRRGIMKQRGFVTQQEFQHKEKKFQAKVLPTYDMANILAAPHMTQFSLADFNEISIQKDTPKIIKKKYRGNYKALKSEKETLKFFKLFKKKKVYDGSVDTEATSLEIRKKGEHILCVQLSPWPGYSRVLHFYKGDKKIKWAFSKKIINALFEVLHIKKIAWYGVNMKFDFRVLDKFFKETIGKQLRVRLMHWRELLLMYLLRDENVPKDLKTLAHMLTPVRYDKKELDEVRAGRIKKISIKRLTRYAGKDTDSGVRIGRVLRTWFKKKENRKLWRLYVKHEMPFAKDLWEMEQFGCHINVKATKKLRKQVRKVLKKIRKRMYAHAGRKFKIKSNPALADVLFNKLKIKPNPYFKNKTGYSTNKKHLEWLINNRPHPFIDLLRLHRQYSQLLTTTLKGILGNLDENDIVHTDFKPHGTVTGRPSSENPNLLNIPRDRKFFDGKLISVRRVFSARKNYVMIVLDYSQIEVKLIALFANVKRILKALKRGDDFHVITARDMFGKRFLKAEAIMLTGKWQGKKYSKKQIKRFTQAYDEMRQDSKTFNFAMVYQAGDDTLAAQMKKPKEKVQQFRIKFFQKYPQIAKLIQQCAEAAWQKGVLEYPNGRRRRFAKMKVSWRKNKQGRQAFNSLPQGMAGYVMRYAIVRICRMFRKKKIEGFPNLTVYDSLAAEVHKKHVNKAAKIMAKEALRPIKMLDNFIFSIKMGYGNNWQEAEQGGFKMASMKDFQPYTEKKAA